jgi:hypothetical protein
MMKNLICTLILLIACQISFGQEKEITIQEERVANRLMLYAVNENLVDLDITMSVEGTGFRQSKRKPRLTRVPATSKVHILNLMVTKGMQAMYKANITTNDSLSRRALRKPFDLIKIDPPQPLTIYITEGCMTCDTIMSQLHASPYRFTEHILAEKPDIKEQISRAFVGASTPIDEVKNPIVSILGKVYINIEDYETLMDKLFGREEKEEVEE